MRRFLITSPNFSGEAELVYNDDGLLTRIDLAETNMMAGQRTSFKATVPAQVAYLETAFKETKVMVVEAGFEVTLEDFKREYPYKRNAHLLPPIWDKMSKSEQVQAWEAAKEYRKYTQRQKAKGFDYTPRVPAGWLKDKEYLNDWKKL